MKQTEVEAKQKEQLVKSFGWCSKCKVEPRAKYLKTCSKCYDKAKEQK